MYDFLRALMGSNVSNIFILFGLGLVAIGLFGGISGKIELDKVGRFASVIIGGLVVVAGLWMGRPGPIVETVEVSSPTHSVTKCPSEVKISGIIVASGPGDVAYQFEYGDRIPFKLETLAFDKAGTKAVNGVLTVSETSTVTATLKVFSGKNIINANAPVVISVICGGQPSTKPPVPEPSTITQSQSSCLLKPRTDQQPGPGVNCKTVNDSTTEPIVRLICADADLAELDGQLSKMYLAKRDSAQDKVAVIKEQIMWNKLRNETCEIPLQGEQNASALACAKPCLLRMMKDRLAEQPR